MTQLFLSMHWEKNRAIYQKSLVKFQFRQWLNFLGQND